MLNRIRLSIVKPEGLIMYRKDGLFKAIFYTLFFALFMATSTIVNTITFDGLSPAARQDLANNMDVISLPCEIVDAQLSCSETVNHTFYQEGMVSVHINSDAQSLSEYSGTQYHFVLQDDRIALIFMNMVITDKPISELDASLHQLDFSLATNSSAEITQAIIAGMEQELIEARFLWGGVSAVSRVFSALLLFHFFILINTLLLRGRLSVVPFKHLYVMLTYASTLLYVILIFDSIISLNFFMFIVLLFVAFRQTSRLALDLQRRVEYNMIMKQKNQFNKEEDNDSNASDSDFESDDEEEADEDERF